MKSVLQAGWLLTVAVGNIIVLIVAEAGAVSEQVRAITVNHLPSRQAETRMAFCMALWYSLLANTQ